MTAEDRELLQALRRRQADLAGSLARIDDELATLERRAQAEPPPPVAEAVPVSPKPLFPPVPTEHTNGLPPLMPTGVMPPPAPWAEAPLPPVPQPSLEFQFGRWLTRIGAVFGIITLVLILSLTHHFLFRILGPGGILGLSALACVGLVIWAERIERRLLIFGRTVLSLGLAGLYVTLYAAHSFDSVRIISSPLLAGVLLLLWSVYVLGIADRKKSQSLALFSIALAYFSTAINPVGRFTMAADLLLAGTVVLFLLRNGWAALSYLSLFGTYLALLRRLVMDQNGEIVLDTSRTLPFAPYAVYLVGAWVIFTAAVLMTRLPSFRGSKRLVFLCLNNGALAGLLPLAAYIAGYGERAMGWSLLWTGFAFLILAAGGKMDWRRSDATDMRDAYFAQGVAVFTLGLMAVYSGATRGLLLAIETLFLGMAGIYARGLVMKIAAGLTALLATLFLTCLGARPGRRGGHAGQRLVVPRLHSFAARAGAPGGFVVLLLRARAGLDRLRHGHRAERQRAAARTGFGRRAPHFFRLPCPALRAPAPGANPPHRGAGACPLSRGNRRGAAALHHRVGRGRHPRPDRLVVAPAG
jgi:hypothetical protein